MSDQHQQLVKTARTTAIWYLVLAVSGVVGFLVIHSKIYVSGDLPQTLANLKANETMARMRLLLELAIVVSQAVAAVYFYKLFQTINATAAWSLAAWGTVNAMVIMLSAIAMGGAINVANAALPANEQLIMVRMFDQIIRHAWGVGSLFFGLWLLPMGYIITRSKRMPVWLGRTLLLGGFGYLASTFLNYAGFKASWVDLLTIPASIGEFWIIGYMLIVGIRPENGQ